MIYPSKLKIGDTIGIFAPAGFYDKDLMLSHIDKFKNLGFNIKLGSHLFDTYKYLAGTDQNRAYDFMELLQDSEVKALMAFRGGYGCIRMLPHISLDVIVENPKIICGFSDLTVLLNYISQKTNLITYHGPMINSDLTDIMTRNSFLNCLCGNYSTLPLKFHYMPTTIYNPANVNGTLVGGNLSLICSSLSTPYEINTDNSILLLEDVNESPYKIDRLLSQLLLSSKLDNCNGFIIGYVNYTDSDSNDMNSEIKDIIEELLVPLGKPIILGYPFGHSYPNLCLPLGANITLDIDNNKLIIS